MDESVVIAIIIGIMLIFLGYMGLLLWWTYVETR